MGSTLVREESIQDRILPAPQDLEARDEDGRQTAWRPEWYTNTAHRDETHDLAEISSTYVRLELVGDQFFQCAYSVSDIDLFSKS